MVISFTISKKGKRYMPHPKSIEERDTNEQDQERHNDGERATQVQNQSPKQVDPSMHTGDTASPVAKSSPLHKSTLEQLKALGPSFSLNLFQNGFTIGDTNEILHEPPIILMTYSTYNKHMLTSVECGHLPVGIREDIHELKYVNGSVLCQVRDYRVYPKFPVIYTVPLKMGLDNIIEDLSSMSQQFSYDDMMEFQSAALRIMYPNLNLDPNSKMDFCNHTIPVVDLGIDREKKRRRTTVSPEVDTQLDRFLMLDMVAKRHAVPQTRPVDRPEHSMSTTSGRYSTFLISSHLNADDSD